MVPDDILEATIYMQHEAASNPVINTLHWVCVQASPLQLQDVGGLIVSSLISRYYTPLTSWVVDAVSMYQVSLRNLNSPSEGWDSTGALWAGTNGTASLPPFVTYSVKKQRVAFDFRNGRLAIPGVASEALSAVGLPSEAVKGVFALWGDAIGNTTMNIEDDAGDMQFDDAIVRKSPTAGAPPTGWTLTGAWSMTKFGTQNSRKN